MGRGGGEHKSSPRREQLHKNPLPHRQGVCQGMRQDHLLPTDRSSLPQGHPGLIIHNPSSSGNKVLPYKKRQKNPLAGLKQKKDPPGERGHGEQGAQVRLSHGGARPGRRAANGLRQQELMPMLKSSPMLFLLPAARFARPCPTASGAESTWGKARRGAKGAQMPPSAATWLACGVSQSLGKEHG